jgi:hypothetical protein
MRTSTIAFIAAVTLGAALPAQDGDWQPADDEQAARLPDGPMLKGQRLARAVGKLTRELTWQRDLADAAAAARQAGKPIFWLQLLGDLRGYT